MDSGKTYKCIVLGTVGVGKTSIINSMKHIKEDVCSTTSSSFYLVQVEVDNQRVDLSVWDTPGQDSYQELNKIYYQDSMAGLLIFDLTDEETLLKLQDYLHDFNEICPNAWAYLVGNKLDLDRQVSRDTAEHFATKNNLKYFEVSAVTNENISILFHQIARDSFNEREANPAPSSEDNHQKKEKCKT